VAFRRDLLFAPAEFENPPFETALSDSSPFKIKGEVEGGGG